MLVAFRGRRLTVGALGDAESGAGIKPQRASLVVHIYGVAGLGNGVTISLRTAPSNCNQQVTQGLQLINRDALNNSRQQ